MIYEYSKKQVDWLKENESNMWAFFTSENLLYNEDYQKIRKYVEYSPNAPGMPVEAPGKTANWLGERIVTEFMKKNPGMSFENLLKQTDEQKILKPLSTGQDEIRIFVQIFRLKRNLIFYCNFAFQFVRHV